MENQLICSGPSQPLIEEAAGLEDALRRSEALIRCVMAGSADCMKVLDLDGRLLEMNEPGQRLMGIIDIGSFLDTCWVDWWSGPDRVRAAGALIIARAGGTGRFEAFARTPGGEEKWWDVAVTPILGCSGTPERLLSVSRDITAYKRAEKALREACDAAETANRVKDHFLAVLSHELRTPLSPVLSTAQMMERDASLPEAAREGFAVIRRNAELQARLIDDLLDITRISRGKLELTLAVVDVHDRLRHVAEILHGDAISAKLTVTVGPAARLHHVEGDPTRLTQVFWNLLKNAIKFSLAGGNIQVATRNTPAGEIVVSVADQGIGIDPALLPKLFDAFEQGGRDITRLFGGLGLGLSITKALVDLHGGAISVRSEGKGHGSEFTITFATTSPAADPPKEQPGFGGQAKGDCRILLVEDHVDTARVMGRLLAASGHWVRTAHTVAAALEVAHSEKFDLVISDLGLPDGSGLDLMRQLLKRMPIKGIALTGYGMEEDIRQTRSAGFAEHLIKPVDVGQLEVAIHRGTGGC